ncbi:MAG: tRNA (5-methylaminomethyl-2-thiouridine)(34)-methyltransferase MnmD [Pseudomonadota bacterium]
MTDKKSNSGNDVIWLEDQIPFSQRFEDTYFSKTDGRAETSHVFLGGNNLPQRWHNQQDFMIVELGFGTGLNFLETLRQWNRIGNSPARLDFVSFELYPLDADSMRKAHAKWPELDEISTELTSRWIQDADMQQIEFDNNVTLSVFASDANARLPRFELSADAFFLDGFSPAKNPELWSAELLQSVFDHTKPGGTFATYTAAGWVRRNLESAGFETEKIKGFANKRHMLIGRRPKDG